MATFRITSIWKIENSLTLFPILLQVNVVLLYQLNARSLQYMVACCFIGLRGERSGVRYLPPPCCVLEQGTLLPKSTSNIQEAMAPSQH